MFLLLRRAVLISLFLYTSHRHLILLHLLLLILILILRLLILLIILVRGSQEFDGSLVILFKHLIYAEKTEKTLPLLLGVSNWQSTLNLTIQSSIQARGCSISLSPSAPRERAL